MTWNVKADGYYITLPEWIEELDISPQAFRLWCRLAKLANREREISKRRTREELAELMGCSKDTVDRWVKELEGAQALDVQRDYDVVTKRYRPSTYTVLTARPAETNELVGGGRTDAARGTDAATPGRKSAATGGRTDADASSTSEKEHPLELPAPPGGARSASSSPRPSPQAEGLNGSADAGLTPSARNIHVAPARSAEPTELARRLFALAEQPLARNVRTLVPILADLLANGFSAEAIEGAALAPECRAWTYNGLAFQAKERKAQRRDRPSPPVVVWEPEPEKTPEEIERTRIAREKTLAEVKARKDARLAAERAKRAARSTPTLQAPAEEVAG